MTTTRETETILEYLLDVCYNKAKTTDHVIDEIERILSTLREERIEQLREEMGLMDC